MESKNIFEGLVEGLNGIGFYNPKMKVYSLKSEGNACKKVFDYLCCNISVNENERLIKIHQETKPIINKEGIRKLEEEGFNKL